MAFGRIVSSVAGVLALGCVSAWAQQATTVAPATVIGAEARETTGAPGSPDATTTIDGRYLPPPPQRFQGKIDLNAARSRPAWPARVVPPEGAPNILLIMTDDVGFAAPSTFGGVIPTPRSTASPQWACATPTSTRHPCARRRARR